MNPSLQSRAGTLILIILVHLAVLWFVQAARNPDPLTLPVPLPMVMAEMMPMPQPKAEIPRPQPALKPPPKQTATPKPPREVPKTTTSEKALTAPKQTESPVAPAANPEPAPPAPPAPPAQTAPPAPPAPPAPLTPPRFNAAYLNNPPPIYPPLMRRAGEEGRVLLRVFVTAEGTAGEVRVIGPSSSPLFDEAAVAAVRQWRFVPARRGETAVAEWAQVPIVFKLN